MHRRRMGQVNPAAVVQMMAAGITDSVLAGSIREAEIEFAEGDSDADSIRDYDSGPGPIQWSSRQPYWYHRELNAEGLCDRRRMVVKKVAPGSVAWGPEAESDDDGYVDQVSFVLDAKGRTDDGKDGEEK